MQPCICPANPEDNGPINYQPKPILRFITPEQREAAKQRQRDLLVEHTRKTLLGQFADESED